MSDLVGCIGPGRMGRGIARRLVAVGFPVLVLAHREGLDLEDFRRAGGEVTTSLRELASRTAYVLLTLPSSSEVEAVMLGSPGLLADLREGSVVVDLSTSLPTSTRMLAERLRTRGIQMLDASMAGGPRQAAAGELNLIVGGEPAVYARCLPVLQALAKRIFHVGGPGQGHLVKLINNFLALVNHAALAEVLPLAVKCGLDLGAMAQAIRASWGSSRVFETALPAICRREFAVTFPLDLCHKDLEYLCRLGREENMPLPMAKSALQVFGLARAFGLGEENSNALVKMWEQLARVEVRGEIPAG